MGNENTKIKSFTDLDAWKEGHSLVIMVYKLTKDFPTEEKFGLANQMRRAAVSITSNIAEGFSRRTSKEKLQFYSISKGSNTELQNQLLIAKDVEYISQESFDEAAQQSARTGRLITGLIKYFKA